MDDDILEVGEDGAFEIVTTKTVKQAEVVHPNYEVTYASDDEEDVQQQNHEALQTLQAGEYRIYRSAGFIYVIVRLPEGEQTTSVGVQSQILKVHTESGNTLNVPLKECGQINTKDGRCTIWKDFLTVKYPIV